MSSLSSAEVESFILRGFVPLREAFPRALAERCRDLLWEQLDVDRSSPSRWTEPVIRLGVQHAPPFCAAANTPRLHGAFDQLVGVGRWVAHPFLSGTVVVRFPVGGEPDDTGWHVDGAFAKHDSWWLNLRSDGRSLLMLVLFSDVGLDDAPTRIRIGSHLDVPAVLEPAGAGGALVRRRGAAPAATRRPARAGPRHGRRRGRVPLPSVPGPRRRSPPRGRGEVPGPAGRAMGRPAPAVAARRRLLAGRDRHPDGARPPHDHALVGLTPGPTRARNTRDRDRGLTAATIRIPTSQEDVSP